MLEAQDVSVLRQGRALVDRASLGVKPGELVGLIGPNGAGKSTLMRALAGLLPCEGAIMLDGDDLAGLAPCARARKLAYLPQNRQVEWDMRVDDVVALGRHPFQHGLLRLDRQDDALIASALEQVGAAHLAERSARSLSGGEMALVLLARALVSGTRVLLADEPMAGLDPLHQLHAMEILRARAQQGTAVLAVLHEVTLAARFCDRVIVMAQGQVISEGPPGEVLDAALFEQVYGVRALSGEHQGQNWLLPWSRIGS